MSADQGDQGDQGDFKGQQFAEKEVASKVVEQYDADHARTFYKYVMGGGGLDIHYGVYRKASDGVYESSKETNARLLTSLDWTRPVTTDSVVLDLGSGHGGLSHEIAAKFGCKVVGANISPEQNKMNMDEAKKLGVDHLIEVVLCDFNEGLPAEWADKFTHIVSCEVLCHAASKSSLFLELSKVLIPGGAFVFTDIMGADGADEKELKDFTDRNATTRLARPSEYLVMLKECGYVNGSFMDFSYNLIHYFKSMLEVCTTKKDAMISEGITEAYLAKWVDSLSSRVEIQDRAGVFAWGIFTARKEGPAF
jgi:sarcosine/dimethylglycine N-methyltransferase